MMATAFSNFSPVDTELGYHCASLGKKSLFRSATSMHLRFFKRAEQITMSALEARTLLPFAFLLMLAFLVALAWDGFSVRGNF